MPQVLPSVPDCCMCSLDPGELPPLIEMLHILSAKAPNPAHTRAHCAGAPLAPEEVAPQNAEECCMSHTQSERASARAKGAAGSYSKSGIEFKL
jgi:hypothetical protein